MGRRARYDKKQIMDSALELIAEGGPEAATIAAIAGGVGAPTGSLYYRYGSRELLLADLWLTVVEDFQGGMLGALASGPEPVQAGIGALLFISEWVRKHPSEARVLLLHRKEDFIDGEWPQQVRERAAAAGGALAEGIRNFTRRLYGNASAESKRRVYFALDIAYGAVKRYVELGKAPPPEIDDMIKKACLAVLGE